MDLKQQGFRFIYRAGVYSWKHPAEVPADATDCTDMSGQEFSAFVDRVETDAFIAMHPEQA